jgi:hypothetical protein
MFFRFVRGDVSLFLLSAGDRQGQRKETEMVNNNSVTYPVSLHPSERKLIEAIRSIESGEIETVKIQNSLPVIFKIALGEGRFCEEEVAG